MTAGASEVVIATKLFRPESRQEIIGRPRLHVLLRQGSALPLTLVAAPAGYGKSILVSDWLRHDAVAAGWLSLDRGDDDPKRFWQYLLLAADQAQPGAGGTALRRLDAKGSDVRRDVLPVFINELTASAQPVVLVLDDYHLVSSAEVHATVAALLDRCPPALHLVFITRADPPLPLSRLRVRGELAELRAEHLRFTVDEAMAFFSSRLETPLSPRDVRRLVARTEGWAAGLQLAALRLRGRDDASECIDRFSGADSHIVMYLAEEVLDSQPPRLREFLLLTSVLNRICAPLCNALTGHPDGAHLIDKADRANLFLIPLDDERRWFRYHHLFGGLLRHELTRTAPEKIPVLHQRAAQWYAEHDDAAEAIGHALESGDAALSKRLVTAYWLRYFNDGQYATVRRWLDALPAGLVASDAPLSAARAWVALDTGRLEEVAAVLDAAETAGPPDIHLSVLRALEKYKAGDVAGAARRLEDIDVISGDPFVATVQRLVQGIAAMWLGDSGHARELLAEAARRADGDGNRLAYIYAQGCRAVLATSRGDLSLAESLVTETESITAETLSDAHFVAMFPRLAEARLASRRGDWARAAAAAAAAVALGRRGAARAELAAALLTAATAIRTRPEAPATPTSQGGAASEPGALVAEARGILRSCADPGPVVASWLADEERAEATQTRQAGMVEPLTDRELAILRLLPAPTPQRELASALFVSMNTLRTHLRAIYRKLGADSRWEAVVRARERGLI